MGHNETPYRLYYKFDYNGHAEDFDYSVTFDDLMKAIRAYFDFRDVTLDGTDTNVFNTLSDLDVIDEIFDQQEEWLQTECEEEAYEAYKEWVDWYYEDEENE